MASSTSLSIRNATLTVQGQITFLVLLNKRPEGFCSELLLKLKGLMRCFCSFKKNIGYFCYSGINNAVRDVFSVGSNPDEFAQPADLKKNGKIAERAFVQTAFCLSNKTCEFYRSCEALDRMSSADRCDADSGEGKLS